MEGNWRIVFITIFLHFLSLFGGGFRGNFGKVVVEIGGQIPNEENDEHEEESELYSGNDS